MVKLLVNISTNTVKSIRKSFSELKSKYNIAHLPYEANFDPKTKRNLGEIPGYNELQEQAIKIRTRTSKVDFKPCFELDENLVNNFEKMRVQKGYNSSLMAYLVDKRRVLRNAPDLTYEYNYIAGPEALRIEDLAEKIDKESIELDKLKDIVKEAESNYREFSPTSKDFDNFCTQLEDMNIYTPERAIELYKESLQNKRRSLRKSLTTRRKWLREKHLEIKKLEKQLNNLTNPVEPPSVELQQLNDYYRSLENAQKSSKIRRRNHHLYNVKKQKEINSNIERQRERHSRVVDLYGEKLTINNGSKFDLSNSNISLPYNSTTIGKLKELRGTRSDLINGAKHIFADEMGYPSELISLKAPEGIRFGDAEFDYLKGCIYIEPTKFRKYADYSILRHEMDHLDKAARLCATIGVDEYEKIFSTKYPGVTINRDFWTKIIEYAKPLSREEALLCRKALTENKHYDGGLNYNSYLYFNNFLEDSAYKKQMSLLSSLNSKSKVSEVPITALKMQEIRQNIIQNPNLDLKKYGERYYFEKAVDDSLESIGQSVEEIDYLDLLDNVSKKLKE